MRRFVIAIFLIFSFFLVGCSSKKENPAFKNEVKEKKTYSFYKLSNKERYELYQKSHPKLSEKEVILFVNLGLDQDYYTHTSPSKYLNTNKVLVNKYYYLDKNYVPDHLVEMSQEYSKGGIFLVDEVYQAFQRLVDDAKKDGVLIRAISAYRSYSYQVDLYNRYLLKDGREVADTYSARPGFSEHQTGLCVDVDDFKHSFTQFEKTDSFLWMQDNAYQYGFILRFPKDKENITGYSYESWHYRFVGKRVARYIQDHHITFDEYYMEFLEN